MAPKKKIAFVYDAIYPYVLGGGEKRLYDVARHLSKKGFSVHLYGMKYWRGKDVIIRDGLTLHGLCPAIPHYAKEGRRSIFQALYFGLFCLKLLKEDFDVLDCAGFPYFSLIACKLVALVKGKKLYSTWFEVWGREYWLNYLGHLGHLGHLVEVVSAKLPDKIISISSLTARRLRTKLGVHQPIKVVPVGIDYRLVEKVKPSKEKSDIIFAGRLLEFKHIDALLQAVAVLKHQRPGVRCFILGDGPERSNLEKLNRQLGLRENVTFWGFLKNQNRVYALMKSSRVFVVPSTREGFGLVVLEANACGLPVVTVRHKDNAAKDLIQEGQNGYVCQLSEIEIAKAMRAVLTRKKESFKRACENKARSYGWERIIGRLEEIYQE